MTAPRPRASGDNTKSEEAFRTIGEVAETLDLPQHVLRFWESRFSQLRPLKRGGNRRYYRPEDVALLRAIKTLLYEEGFTIKGVQKRFREQGVKATVEAVLAQQEPPPVALGSATTAARDDSQEASSGESRNADLAEILEELRALRRLLD